MDRNVIVAAKWLGGSLVLSTIILIIGAFVWTQHFMPAFSSVVLSAANRTSATSSAVKVEMPDRIQLAPIDVNIRPVAGAGPLNLTVAPLKVEVVETGKVKPTED